MKLEVLSSQVVGLSDQTRWSQTYVVENLVVVLELLGDSLFSAQELGDSFLRQLTNYIKQTIPISKSTFKQSVVNFLNNNPLRNRIISLVISYFDSKSIYVYCKNSGSTIVKRGNLWSEILNDDGFVTGQIQENDLFIFETQTFKRLINNNILIEKFSTEEKPQLASEKIGSMLHNFDNSKGAAAVFASFKKSAEILEQEDYPKTTGDIGTSISVELPILTTEEIPLSNQFPERPTGIMDVKTNKAAAQGEDVVKNEYKEIKKSAKFTNFYKNLRNQITNILPGKKADNEDVYKPGFKLLAAFSTPKKKILLAVIVLSGVLLTSVVIGVNNSGSKKTNTELESTLSSISKQIEEGEALIDLNNVRAMSILKDSQTSLNLLKDKYKPGTKERIRIDDYLTRVNKAYATVAKIYDISQPDLFLDLTVVKENARGTSMSIYENNVFALDVNNPSIIMVNLDKTSPSIIGGGSKTPEPKLISVHGNNVFVLTKDGLIKIDAKSKSQSTILKSLSPVANVVDLVAFAGNVYFLDDAKMIWKSTATDNGYTKPTAYLEEDTSVDQNQVRAMAIDGSVWVLGDNNISEYTRGVRDLFTIDGLDKPLLNAQNIFTDDSSNFIYILDKGNNRIVVIDKEGKYNSQYVWTGISTVADMVVSESAKKILLLSGSSIYSIDLK